MPTPTINARDFLYIAPEIVLTAWGLLVLVVDFALMRRSPGPRRRVALGWLSLAGVVAALLSLYLIFYRGWGGLGSGTAVTGDPVLFSWTIAGDSLTQWMAGLIALLLAMAVAISMSWDFTEHWGEYYALLTWAAVGMMLLVASEELITLFLTLETMTLCLYLATAFEKSRRRSAEGGLKYFVYGSVSSALFLFGLSLIYGLTGTTRLEAIHEALSGAGGPTTGLAGNVVGAAAVLLVLVGFGFKIAAVPFHQWAPDAYEGAPAGVTAWIASGSKVASFVALMKVLLWALAPWSNRYGDYFSAGWVGVLAIVAAASMTFGNFAALAQRNLKRMLAYSSIAHAGYLLVGVLAASVSFRHAPAAGSVLFYLVVYGFTTAGAFALAAWLVRDKDRDDIDDLNGLAAQSPALAVCIVLLMLSLIGMPPLAGFFGKLYMFMEALRTDPAAERSRLTLIGLVALGLFNSVVSAFYYVRVLKAMFLRPTSGQPIGPAPGGVRWPILAATLVAVLFGVFPAPLLDAMRVAALPMLSAGSISRYAESLNARELTPEERRRLEEDEREAARLRPVPSAAATGLRGPAPTPGATPTPPAPRSAPSPGRPR